MADSSLDPRTPEQWLEAVDAAEALMQLDAARQYGLVTGGPEIDRDRCEEILRRGAELGYHPGPDPADRFIRGLLADGS